MEFNLRPYQKDAAERILSVIEEKSVAFQSPTGSGKTLIALEVARHLGPTSVYSRTLSQYLSWERDCRKAGLSFAGLAGKDRFCLRPKVKDGDRVVSVTRCPLCPFFDRKFSRKQVSELGIVGFLERQRAAQKCAYSWIKLQQADVYLYTYPYYFFYRRLVKGNSLHVFDEAHNLMHVQDMVDVSITLQKISRLRAAYAGTDVQDTVYAVLDALESWIEKGVKEGRKPPDLGSFHLEEVEDHQLASFKRALEKLDDPSYRLYVTPEGVVIKLMDPSSVLSKLNEDRWLLMSGTLPSKSYMEKVWGLKDFEFISINPFNPNLTFYWNRDLSTRYTLRERNRERYVKVVSSLRSPDGITLVLVPSYEVASWFKEVADYVEDSSSSVKSVPGAGLVVVVARGKLSEGVEFVKDGKSIVKRVVIVGIPYPNIGDAYSRDVLEFLTEKMGKRTMWFLLKEEASIIIRQAIGRAVRSESDSAEVFLLDRRMEPFLRDMGLSLKRVKIMRCAVPLSAESMTERIKVPVPPV